MPQAKSSLRCRESSILGQKAPVWKPQRAWIMIVGVLRWRDSQVLRAFPADNRRDDLIAQLFLDLGVPADHVLHLQDEQATSDNLHKALDSICSASKKDDTLIFYYCGHGIKFNQSGFLANYDAPGTEYDKWFSIDFLVQEIENKFHGRFALLTADCCHSGMLAESIKRYGRRISFGVLSSASGYETSTGNWTFSQALLDAFGGELCVDVNNDGRISFTDVAQYLKSEMSIMESQQSVAATKGTSMRQLIFSTVTNLGNRVIPIPHRVEVECQGYWHKAKVIDLDSERIRVRWSQIGYDSTKHDEWVSISRVRRLRRPKKLRTGDDVLVDWHGKQFEATVLETAGLLSRVTYKGFDRTWDEWVGRRRVSQ